MTDVLAQLLPAAFRGIQFPVIRMTMSIAHELAMHTYWGVDGARIEATGLEPMRFTFTVPFINTIAPGKKERWEAGRLYPYQLRQLLDAFRKKADGILQHPEFGDIRCKADKLDFEWEATRRGGADATVSFVETLPPMGERAVRAASPVQAILVATFDLDASDADLRALVPDWPQHRTSFTDFARSIQAIGDQFTVLQYRTAGQINQLLYRCDNIVDSITRARSATTWPLARSVERIRSAAYDIRAQIVRLSRSISVYSVPGDTTLSGVAASLPDQRIADLIKLNPDLVRQPEIKRGTAVRYYNSNLPV
jgi:prophage DNA circulation protein